MTKIIINADDLGLSKGVNNGILEAYKNGVVNSASLMVTTSYFEETIAFIKSNNLDNIGVHVNLTEGKPLLKTHKTIVDGNGFFKREIYLDDKVNLNEIHNEVKAQIEKAIDSGVELNHIDSHHHVHATFIFRKVFIALSNQYQLPLRKINNTVVNPFKVAKFYLDTKDANYYSTNFSADFFGPNATTENLLEILTKYKGKNLEIMCHPGFKDDENGSYNLERANELKILTSPEIITFIKQNWTK